MEQNSKYNLRQKFDLFVSKIETIIDRKDLNSSMFLFGLSQGSGHYYRDNEISMHKMKLEVFDESLKGQWEGEDLLKIKFGKDDNGNRDEDFGGILYWEYGIKRAVEFNRPAWGFYYWIGHLRGKMNAREENSDEFIRCIAFFSVEFLKIQSAKIIELCNYFDETGEKLHMDFSNRNLKAWFQNE